MYVTSDLNQVLRPTAVAIGNFDGVHIGHQQVLQPVLKREQPGIKTVLTFSPHPQEFFSGRSRPLLTPIGEKLEQLALLGFEQVIQLPFTQDLARQPPSEFIKTVLEQGLEVCYLSIGWDFCFGNQRSGNATTLVAWGETRGIPVQVIPETQWEGIRVSSSRIRAALAAGDVETARVLLGRSYALEGVVIQGDQRGRQLGFPTANLCLPPEKVLPRDGVYSAWVQIANAKTVVPAVMNMGVRPTVDGSQRLAEVHLLDWQGDLYGLKLIVNLEHFIRPEQKFGSLQELQQQIQADSQIARQRLNEIVL